MGDKHWANTWTEIEDLGNGKRSATISVGHRVFFDKADGNKPKKHKLTDNRPDHVVIQGAKCCVEVYPYYAKYFDVQHEEVRLYEERWVVQRWRDPPGQWQDIGAWNPQIAVEEYPEPAGDVVKVTITYDTDYGPLTVEYFQRDGNALKHNVTFQNTSGPTETFRVVQAWDGIVGDKCNGKDIPEVEDTPFLAFHNADKAQKEFNIAENLYSMIFNEDGSEKTDQCLQRPVGIETHAQGMKADFIYGNWILAQNESLEIDPDTATLAAATIDIYIGHTLTRFDGGDWLYFGAIAGTYYRACVEWDISGIDDGATITDTVFRYEGTANNQDSHIHEMLGVQPSAEDDDDPGNQAIYDEAGEGNIYADPVGFPEVGATKSADLGAQANTDLQNQLGSDWFAIGLQADTEVFNLSSSIYASERATADPKPTLYVEYSPAGYTGGNVEGVAAASIAEVDGVPTASIAKVDGV